jgi:hypothetical protein
LGRGFVTPAERLAGSICLRRGRALRGAGPNTALTVQKVYRSGDGLGNELLESFEQTQHPQDAQHGHELQRLARFKN